MTEQRTPRLAWVDDTHFQSFQAMPIGSSGEHLFGLVVRHSNVRDENPWLWSMGVPGWSFKSEWVASELDAKLAAEDALFGVAALIAQLFGIQLELPTEPGDEPYQRLSGPIHDWFGLSYCTHLVMPRTLLQGMPLAWQTRFVALLKEWDEAVSASGIDLPPRYVVTARGADGRLFADPLPHYRHTRIVLGEKAKGS